MTKALQPNCVFERVEKKYKLSDEQYRRFVAGLKGKMAVDDYGRHTICNLYYDTPSDELIRRSIEKPKYKEKIRLRSYGIPTPESTVFLEIKKKWKAPHWPPGASIGNKGGVGLSPVAGEAFVPA